MITDQYVQSHSRGAQQALRVQCEQRLSHLNLSAFCDCIRPGGYRPGTLRPMRRDFRYYRSSDECMYDFVRP